MAIGIAHDLIKGVSQKRVVTLLRGGRNTGGQHFQERPEMVRQPQSHGRRLLSIPTHSLLKRKPQGLMSPMEVVIEDLSTDQRIPCGIPFRKGMWDAE